MKAVINAALAYMYSDRDMSDKILTVVVWLMGGPMIVMVIIMVWWGSWKIIKLMLTGEA